MDLVGSAQRIRQFFRALFGSDLIVELRREVEEIRADRDYFRGRAERLELLLQERPVIRAGPMHQPAAGDAKPQHLKTVGGHKSWKTIQREHRERMAKALEEREEEKRDAAAAKAAAAATVQ